MSKMKILWFFIERFEPGVEVTVLQR